MTNYIEIPQSVSLDDIRQNNYILSSNSYKQLIMKNTNYKRLGDLLDRKLTRQDLGQEVGSLSYIKNSPYYFMRSKALQSHSFLPQISKETTLPILPQSFIDMSLKKGDLIISKDSNIGEIVILDKDYQSTMLSGALYKLPITKNKFYIFALIKHEIFRQQLDFIVPKGATIRHAKTLFLECQLPFPNHNAKQTIQFIETIVQSIIIKENLIKERHSKILETIEKELIENQKDNRFVYSLPNIHEVKSNTRLDTGIYCEEFKKLNFLVKNYTNGYSTFKNLGFSMSRGQNLQESCIGKSIYSELKYENFYSLAMPTNFSNYGTLEKTIYLGNSNHLKTLKKGEIIFGAEATFRSIVIIDSQDKYITNIHGITLYKNDLINSIFVKLFMDFLVSKDFVEYMKVGGHGGSLAQKYWDIIPFPNFTQDKQKEIATLYHNPNAQLTYTELNLENFTHKDNEFCQKAGIYELDKSIKHLKKIIYNSINCIVKNEEVKIKFL